MGLDATIKRLDGEPLGVITAVQQELAKAFPGVTWGQSVSGPEKIRLAANRGIIFPEVIRQSMEATAAEWVGHFEGQDHSVEFFLGSATLVDDVSLVFRGRTGALALEQSLKALEHRLGWTTTFP